MPRKTKDPKDQILTGNQERFIDEYMLDFNGKRAAVRAGYSEAAAQSFSSQLLSKPNITAEIQRRLEERRHESKGRSQRVIDEIYKLACETPDMKHADKKAALELAAKHYGLINDKIDHTIYSGGDAPTIAANATPAEAIEVYARLLN